MIWFRCGSLIMLLGVAFGAFGAHGLKGHVSAETLHAYQTGVLYHLIHGLALFAVGGLASLKPATPPEQLVGALAGVAFIAGILLFSGSLYLLSFTGIKQLGLITPVGGLAFLIGWLFLAAAAKP